MVSQSIFFIKASRFTSKGFNSYCLVPPFNYKNICNEKYQYQYRFNQDQCGFSLSLAGTKRPQRHFFAALQPKNGALMAVEGVRRCPVPTFKPMNFPIELELTRLPGGSDFGGCGLWGHSEFCKHLAVMSKGTPANWSIKELDIAQQSLSLHVALGTVKETVCKEKGPKVSEHVETQDDFSFLNMDCLLPGRSFEKPKQKPMDSDGSELEVDDLGNDDLLFSDSEMAPLNMDKQIMKELNPKQIPADSRGAPAEKAEEKAPSEAGSQSGQRVKTLATQMDIVEAALREIGRRGLGSGSKF